METKTAKYIPTLSIKVEKSPVPQYAELYCVRTSSDARDAFMDVFNSDTLLFREEGFLLCLNRKNEVMGSCQVCMGGFCEMMVDIKVIMSIALQVGACSIIFAHNHPSGNTNASEADKKITKKLKDACALMDIKMLDHLIITQEGYMSFADEGLI